MKKKLLPLIVSVLMGTFLTACTTSHSDLEEEACFPRAQNTSDIQARLSTMEDALNATSAQLEDVASILKNDPRIEKLQNELKSLRTDTQREREELKNLLTAERHTRTNELKTLRNELQEPKPVAGKTIDAYSMLSSVTNPITLQTLIKYLNAIEPPDNPTKSDIKKYIANIYLLKSFTNQEPSGVNTLIQVRLIERGHDVFPELLPYLDYYNIAEAAKRLITRDDKELLISKLPLIIPPYDGFNPLSHPTVALYLRIAGESDKDNIVALAENFPQALSALKTFKLNEEEVKKLARIILNSWDPSEKIFSLIYDNLNEKDFYDLCSAFVRQRVDNSRMDKYKKHHYHFFMASLGYLPSAKYLIENPLLSEEEKQFQGHYNIVPYLPAEYENAQKKWWDENEGNIVYDKTARSYILKSDKKK